MCQLCQLVLRRRGLDVRTQVAVRLEHAAADPATRLDSYFRNSGDQCFVITISRVSENGDFAVPLYHYYVRVLAQVSRDL